MKNIVLGAAFVLISTSWAAAAEEHGAPQAKASMEEQCKAMAEQHGMKGDKSDAWVKKCLEMLSDKAESDKGADKDKGMKDMNDGNDMQDPEDGDAGMGGETK